MNTTMSDFVQALQNGHKDTWKEFYEQSLLPLRRQIAAKYSALSLSEVDDVWTRVIATVFTKINTLSEPDALGDWLWRIAQNAALKYIRDKHVHVLLILLFMLS